MNVRKTICLAALILTATAIHAEEGQWKDMTKWFVENPNFDNNSREGWEWESNASTQEVRVNCISFYAGNFNLHQELKGLPKGHYRLSVQGFYRMTDNQTSYNAHQNGTEQITASLYAGTASKKLTSLYSQSVSYNAGGRSWTPDDQHYYPDGKEAALSAFQEGLYWNELEFDGEGDVLIGINCDSYQSNNYCVLDNFKLEYQGESGPMWIDLTDQLLQNPRFNNNDQSGWQWESGASSQVARCECMEFWNGSFNLFQNLYGLTKGKYRLSVQAYYRVTENDWGYDTYKEGNEEIPAVMYAGEKQQPLVSVYTEPSSNNVSGSWRSSDGKYYPNSMESARVWFDEGKYWNTMEFEAEGDIAVGLKTIDYTSYSNWCIFDNFKLEYYGELENVSEVSLSMDKQEFIVGETGRINSVVKPLNALVKNLEWSSSNPSVVTVDNGGYITAVGGGTAVITATSVDGSNVSASITVTVTRNKPTAGSLIINEIMASNVDEYISPAYNFDGWIELYNPSDQTVELSGLTISDPANGEGPWTTPTTMGTLPAKSYALVWFDSNNICETNAPFKLDTDGGIIVIADDEGNEIARQAYPASLERISYARTSDGAEEWGNTATPTPAKSNNGIATAKSQLAAPVVNQPSQLFNGELVINVDIPAGTTLRYTTDTTLPTMTNGETSKTGQFKIDYTTIYRFRLFADGYLPSRVTTRSYIQKYDDFYLPVVSVVSDWDFLYDDMIGVYTKGTNGRPGNGQSSNCNWNMDWERPVNFSYLDANGEMVLNQDVNLEMCGGWSRAWTPHSFKLKGNKELGGDKNLNYRFFEQKPYIRNRTLQIRNGGNDNNGRFKDPSLQYVLQTSGINLDCQSYQPVHEFINGSYVGLLNVREPNNKHYVYANYGWDDDEIDQFEMSPDSGYVQKCGTPEAFNELVDVLSPDAANSETYQEICRLLDIDAYANYMAAEFYMGGTDWPQNNVKGFRHRDNGRFRFVVFDLDGTFATNDPFNVFMGKETYTFDQLYPTSLGRIRDKIRFVTLFKNLIKNADFRRRFIDAYSIMGGSVFQKNRVTTIVDQLKARVEPAMNMEWSGAYYMNNSANEVKNFMNNRLTTATTALKNYTDFGLKYVTTQRVTLKSDTEGAKLFINDQVIPTGQFTGNLFTPVTLRAEAPAGYAFAGWLKSGKVQSTEASMKLPTGNLELTASFRQLTESEMAKQGITPVRINEVSGSNDSYVDEYGKKGDWVELYNTTDEPIDVEGMYLTDNLTKPTKYQITKGKTNAQTVIPAHGYLVIWCDNKRATTDLGLHATFKIDGDGGKVALMAADRSWTDVITYPAHDARTTIGRYPDGGTQVYAMSVTTIGSGNALSSYVTEVAQDKPVVDAVATVSAANGFRLRYGSQTLLVKSEDADAATVEIYTAGGALVERTQVDIVGGKASISVSHLPSGFYVAHATDAEGQRVSCKFMK